MNNYSVLLFDFDGTLVDTAPDITDSVNHILGRLGKAARSAEEVKSAIGKGVHELFTKLVPGQTAEWIHEAASAFKEYYARHLVVKSRPYPGVVEVLTGGLSGFPKAVVTNKPDDLTRIILRKLDLESLFVQVIGMGVGYAPKPDPEGVHAICRKLGVRPEDAVLIGDSSIDWDTARNAGTDFAWVSYGYEKLDSGSGFHVFHSAREWEVMRHGRL